MADTHSLLFSTIPPMLDIDLIEAVAKANAVAVPPRPNPKMVEIKQMAAGGNRYMKVMAAPAADEVPFGFGDDFPVKWDDEEGDKAEVHNEAEADEEDEEKERPFAVGDLVIATGNVTESPTERGLVAGEIYTVASLSPSRAPILEGDKQQHIGWTGGYVRHLGHRELARYLASQADAAPVAIDPLKPRPEHQTRKSIFGHTFSKSAESDWTNYPGAGWVYGKVEGSAFAQHYKQCSLSKEWGKSIEMHSTIDGACVIEAVARKAGMVQCEMSHGYTTPEDIVELLNTDSESIKVSRKYVAKLGGPIKCDHSGGLFIPKALTSIADSDKYQRVCRKSIATSGLFSRCVSCGDTFESAKAVERPDMGKGKILCKRCYHAMIKHKVILGWDSHEHPPAIYAPVELADCTTDPETGLLISSRNRSKIGLDSYSLKQIRLFGCEAESELARGLCEADDWDRVGLALSIRDTVGADFIGFHEDGTLTLNGKYSDKNRKMGESYAGFEIISAPASLAIHRERWGRFTASAAHRYLRAWDTDTCGFHVHVNRESLTTLQISRILKWINCSKNTPFVRKIAGRNTDICCRYIDKEFSDVLHPERVNNPDADTERRKQRWTAFNLTNDHTVEFRIFRGTVNPRHIIRNLEFCDAICDFCYPGLHSFQDIIHGPDPFILYVNSHRKEWPLLAEWLGKHGLIKTHQALPERAHPDKVTLRPWTMEEGELPTD